MLRALLGKDLCRAWRNPLPWMLNLALPLCLTAIIGLAFGSGGEDDNQLGRIKFALVDQDDSVISQFLRGVAGQGNAAKYLDPVFLERDEALRQLNDSKLSAMLVIPTNFTSNYLTGRKVELELVKNPAEQIHPAVLEELLGVVVTGMNALSLNFLSEFPALQRMANGEADSHEIAMLIDSSGGKFKALRQYLYPPLVGLKNDDKKEDASSASTPPADAKKEIKKADSSAAPANSPPKFNLFGYLLAGMTAMFLLMLASQGMADLHRELSHRTFERYHTVRERVLPFVAGKALFTAVIVATGAVILLGGGSLLFHFRWPRPFELTVLTLAYVCFATGLMAVLVALAPNERYGNALNNMVSMIFGLVCVFPSEQLPPLMRDKLAPALPTYWYAHTARELWWSEASWATTACRLLLVTGVCLGLAALLFRRRFKEGIRS